ncbi:GlxA family transcriptional regulator [Nguyenibacter vanlangensis]|uniref:GlxA family transcriptional regulator n=1 Tax=Nguyenibacter vanlangensis TaxID=1216886 RepID=A0ABZ3DBC2_9PROT
MQDLAAMPDDPHFPPNFPRRVEILAFPNVQLLDVTGPLQVFGSANIAVRHSGRAAAFYAPVMIAAQSVVTSSSGLGLVAQPLPPMTLPVDTLLVAGGIGVNEAAANPILVNWLRNRAQAARRVASICTGAFLLAEAGLLDNRRAVTHWSRCAELAQRFPAISVEPDPIFIRDGTTWTSAGVTAGIDLALAQVESDLGRDVALAVARDLVVFLKRPGGQAQFSTLLALQMGGGRFDTLHSWMATNLASDLTLSRLAEQAGMSERSFSRHYVRATGRTPLRAVEELRVEAACRLLAETAPIKRIAERCGFGSEETLRRGFLRCLSTTPGDYRDHFGG